MKRIVYTCDRCKQEIEGDPAKFFSDVVDRESGDLVYDAPHPELKDLDFCRNCNEFFVGLIKRHCEKGVPAVVNKDFEKAVQEMVEGSKKEPENDGPPPAEEKTRRKLDNGKIGALRNAGWTVKAIAGEMNCSEAAVYNVLKNLGIPVGKRKAPEPESTEQSTTT